MSINAISGLANVGTLSQARLFTKTRQPSLEGDVVQTGREVRNARDVRDRRDIRPTLEGDVVQTRGDNRRPDPGSLVRQAVQALHDLQAVVQGRHSGGDIEAAVAAFNDAFNNLAAASQNGPDSRKLSHLQDRLSNAFQDILASIRNNQGPDVVRPDVITVGPAVAAVPTEISDKPAGEAVATTSGAFTARVVDLTA